MPCTGGRGTPGFPHAVLPNPRAQITLGSRGLVPLSRASEPLRVPVSVWTPVLVSSAWTCADPSAELAEHPGLGGLA